MPLHMSSGKKFIPCTIGVIGGQLKASHKLTGHNGLVTVEMAPIGQLHIAVVDETAYFCKVFYCTAELHVEVVFHTQQPFAKINIGAKEILPTLGQSKVEHRLLTRQQKTTF